ncbi:DUF6531 domain-containing protein [Micromonospora sp. NPDC049559]|uniref:DUF6531 domain-containing protein n=1 Tax=Micromonospora sp. NPDC049559 TaxID=3155923 RepID=UPI003431F221
MARPGAAEWSVLELDSDPVPGDPESFDEITNAYQELARTTQEAHDLLASGGQIDVGQGKAMEAFRNLIDKLPGRLDRMAHSYGQAADAYLRYLPSLQEAQSMSLRALEQARNASQDQGASQAALALAQSAVAALGGDANADQTAKDRAADDVTAARNRADQAQQALDQAKALLGQATALRDQAARTAAQTLRQLAKDAPQRSLWEKIAEAFQAFVDFLRSTVIEWITTVLDVLSAIASFIFPPLGEAIGLLSGLIDFGSALLGGDAGEIAMAGAGIALGLVPGGRLVGRVMKFAAKGGKLLSGPVADGIKGGVKGLDAGGGRTIGGGFGGGRGLVGGGNRPPVPKDTSVSIDTRDCVTDPVDVATGEMVLAQVDLELPAPLALALERTHVSSYRAGGWFGPSWASTLDQRLEFDAEGACYFAPDGMVLVYPSAPAGAPALPLEGPRWPLTVAADGTAELADPLLGRTLRFARHGEVGLLAEIADADGNRVEVLRDDDLAPTVVRHPSGRRVALRTEAGRITAMRLLDADGEPLGAAAGYGYDERRRLVEVANASGRPMRFEYDDQGRITAWRDRNGSGYRYAYDADGRCVRTEGDGGYLSAVLAYDVEGRITRYTDSLGNTTVYELDDLRHVASETDPLGNTTRFEWGRYNRLLAKVDPLGRITRYGYDDAGRLEWIVRPDGSAVAVTPRGEALSIRVHDRDRAYSRYYEQAPDPRDEPVGVAESFTYERLAEGFGRRADDEPRRDVTVAGRRVTRTGARGGADQVRYDDEGNPVERVDAAGAASRTEYGPFGLVTATVDATGARTTYAYDTELRLTAVTDPRGLVWRYAYDAAGRLVEETDFNGRVLRFGYDAAGQLVRSTNGLGEVTEYEHDLLGNVVERRTPTGTTAYRYDPVGNLVWAANEDAVLIVERDEWGRVVASTTNGRTLSFRYDDEAGTRSRRTPSGEESSWSYDRTGSPVSLRTAAHTTTFRYDEAGRELVRSVDGTVVLAQGFAGGDQLTAQVVAGLRQRRFDYRPDGQLAAISDDRAGRTEFELDPAGRVTGVTGPGRRETYRYDAVGNLTSTSATGSAYLGRLRYDGSLVASAGAVRYRYDPQGRMTARTVTDPTGAERTWHFGWDGHDRLVEVHTPDGDRWRYRYDPLGRRIAKHRYAPGGSRVPAERFDFVWDGTVLVEQAHTDARGERRITTWEHHPEQRRPVAQSVRAGGDALDHRFYSIVTDLVGTPTELVGTDGALAWHGESTLYGAPLDGSGTGADGSGRGAGGSGHGAEMPLRFPGQYLDAETGLHYNLYRYYDPISGRYVSQDPLGLAPAPDPAAYVGNPYRESDPLGLVRNKTTSCAGGGAGGAKKNNRPGAGNDAGNATASGSGPATASGNKDFVGMGEHDGVVVKLDSHQNKHHSPPVFGGELKPYTGGRGERFPSQVNEEWHQKYFPKQVSKIVNDEVGSITQKADTLRAHADSLRTPEVEKAFRDADLAEAKANNAERWAKQNPGDKFAKQGAEQYRKEADAARKHADTVNGFKKADEAARAEEDKLNGNASFSPSKDAQPDGVKYDISAHYDPETGKYNATWHGNPNISRNETPDDWWRDYGKDIQRQYGLNGVTRK